MPTWAVGELKRGTRPPWVGLAAGVLVLTAAGNGYTFPLYSHSLKSVLGFDQRQLAMLGVANDIGENVGILAGVACNRLAPWLVLLVGSSSSFLGFGVLWLALSGVVSNLPYWLLWIALCIGTNSCAWLSTGVLVTNMRNFPLSRGTVAGILKGYGGLSASVFTAIYAGPLHNSSTELLLFLTLGIPILCLSLMFFVRPCTPSLENDSRDHGHFLFVQISSVVLGLYLLSTTLASEILPLSDELSYIFILIMVLMLVAPLAIPIMMTLSPATARRDVNNHPPSSMEQRASDGGSENSAPLLSESASEEDIRLLLEDAHESDVGMLLAEGEGAVKKKRKPRRGEDFGFREVLVKADFWLLFLAYFIGVGTGVTVLNNLAQIGIAVGIDHTTILLALFSFFNFLGRLIGGVIPEHFLRSKLLPRPIWMAFTQLVMAAAYLLFTFAPGSVLYVTTSLLGVCYGVQISVMVPTTSELFGLKHVGVIYNFIGLGNPIGAMLFSGLLAGNVYDKEASKQHGSLDVSGASCLGPDCFRLTFLVLATVSILGSILSLILTLRIKPVYQMLYGGGSFRVSGGSQH